MLVRNARLVPVGDAAPANDGPLDIRIADGVVLTVASKLTPQRGEEVLEAEGRWVIPGLWDQHVHMQQWAQTRTRLDVSSSSCPADVARIVAQHIASLAPSESGSWVFGYGFRSASWADQPTVAELDAVSGRRPVVLTSGDGHTGWLNSVALAAFDSPATSGVLTENPWFALMPVIVARTADEFTTDAAYGSGRSGPVRWLGRPADVFAVRNRGGLGP